jgi:hypothetical protein
MHETPLTVDLNSVGISSPYSVAGCPYPRRRLVHNAG